MVLYKYKQDHQSSFAYVNPPSPPNRKHFLLNGKDDRRVVFSVLYRHERCCFLLPHLSASSDLPNMASNVRPSNVRSAPSSGRSSLSPAGSARVGGPAGSGRSAVSPAMRRSIYSSSASKPGCSSPNESRTSSSASPSSVISSSGRSVRISIWNFSYFLLE